MGYDDREENPAGGIMGLVLALAGGVGVAYYLKKRREAKEAEPRVTPQVEPPAPTVRPPVASDPYGNRQVAALPETPKTGAVEGFPNATWTDVQVGANKVIRAANSGRTVMTAMNETPGSPLAELTVDGIVGPLTFAAMQRLGWIMQKAQDLNTVEWRSPYMGINAAMIPNAFVPGSQWLDPLQNMSEGVPVRVLTSQANQTFENKQMDKTIVRRLLWFAGKATYGNGETAPAEANMGAKYLLAKAVATYR
jgi:hypothetical protein